MPSPPRDVRLYRAETVAAQMLDGEAVLLDLARETYYSLNTVGARVWTLLERGTTVAELTVALNAEFDAPAETIADDVATLTAALLDAGLVSVTPPSGPT